jgi:uncharacterized RDD family membrane protein YckC
VARSENSRAAPLQARLFAFITDGIPLTVLGWLAFFALSLDALGFAAFNFIAFQLYFIAFWWLDQGQTPGMRMVRIRVAPLNGGRIRLGQAVIRALVLYVAFPIAVLSALVRDDQRLLHDLAAGTRVIVQ